MLLKHLQKHLNTRILTRSSTFSFGNAAANTPNNEPNPTTKHNPEGIDDLRGHHHIDQLPQSVKSYSHIHSTKYDMMASYHLASLLPNKVARLLGSLAADPKTAIASDTVYLPRIDPNGVPVYDVIKNVNTYIIINKLLTQFAPLSILLIVPEPALSLFLYLLSYYCYNEFQWKLVRHLCIKVELLPHTEEILYQKINNWGHIVTKKVRISELEATTFQELFQDRNHTERGTRGLFNKQVAFKIRDSDELLLFEKGAIWHEEGINHPLLV